MTDLKAQRREQQHRAQARKRIQHGIGKWTPKQGISKERKKIIAQKISVIKKKST